MPDALLRKPSLERLILYRAQVAGVLPEVLSQVGGENCLASLRAHFDDLAAGAEAMTDIKLLVLGNGRSGKTQLVRRLCDQKFQDHWDSTHGIRIATTAMPAAESVPAPLLHIWDFGGQDIYHGTHALFARTRAVFALVWSEDTNAAAEYEHEDISFRNHPLHYWVTYVRHLAEARSPVLIVQSKCDRNEDEVPRAPVPDQALDGLGFVRELHFGARDNRGWEEMVSALRAAVRRLHESEGVARIGAGRLRVQRRLEALRGPDGALPPERRLLDQATFRAWCAEEGVGAPEHLLAYLNNAGVVFCRAGLFGDRIVLDLAWALNAIYTVFDRTRCYRRLRREGGRFDRARLAELVWDAQGYDAAEQRLFLGMMRACGICFEFRRGPQEAGDDETIYIAPDLLPERAEIAAEIASGWEVGLPIEEASFTYGLLHPGVMRGVMVRIGAMAGLHAVYWRGGVYAYETTTRSRALIERLGAPEDWHGTIRLQTRGGQAGELRDRLAAWIVEESERMGLRPAISRRLPPPSAPENEPKLAFGQEPVMQPHYAVSYAWNDATIGGPDREEVVNRLCRTAEDRGIHVLRDKTDLAIGGSISAFMRELVRCEKVFVILSEKYLRSVPCMTELYEIWQQCRSEADRFRSRVRVFTTPDAHIATLRERLDHVGWWRKEHAEVQALVDQNGPDALSASDYQQFRDMGHFVRHLPDILSVMQDTLRPRSFDDLVRYGFDDPPPAPPPGH